MRWKNPGISGKSQKIPKRKKRPKMKEIKSNKKKLFPRVTFSEGWKTSTRVISQHSTIFKSIWEGESVTFTKILGPTRVKCIIFFKSEPLELPRGLLFSTKFFFDVIAFDKIAERLESPPVDFLMPYYAEPSYFQKINPPQVQTLESCRDHHCDQESQEKTLPHIPFSIFFSIDLHLAVIIQSCCITNLSWFTGCC